jgi:hypothetical protein
MMYHIGIVQHLISPGKAVSSDASVQAVVRMWDANLLILGVEKKIGRKVRKNDFVLADYTPLSPESNHRKLTIVKILPPEEGSRIWADFQDELDRKRAMMPQDPRIVR